MANLYDVTTEDLTLLKRFRQLFVRLKALKLNRVTVKTINDDGASEVEGETPLASTPKEKFKLKGHRCCWIQKESAHFHSVYAEKIASNSTLCRRLCKRIIDGLNKDGICVIDNFLGNELGTEILDEVCVMYKNDVFRNGKLGVGPNKSIQCVDQSVRGDKIVWVTGSEVGQRHIGDLMSIVDSLIGQCNNHPKNGELGKRNIRLRYWAMVTCYPGNGARFLRHIDNSNRNGRCITAIYYLNKDWNKNRGGLLRIFRGKKDRKINISPIFDRMILFWSDERNQHEVLPSHDNRYAITIWYIDEEEFEKFLLTR